MFFFVYTCLAIYLIFLFYTTFYYDKT